jgi:hypothetical protein
MILLARSAITRNGVSVQTWLTEAPFTVEGDRVQRLLADPGTGPAPCARPAPRFVTGLLYAGLKSLRSSLPRPEEGRSAINQLCRCSNEESSTIDHALNGAGEFFPYHHTGGPRGVNAVWTWT